MNPLCICLPKATQKWIVKGESDADGMLKNVLSMKGPSDLILNLFLVGLLPAIGEELFFRGVLQKFVYPDFQKSMAGNHFHGFFVFCLSYAVYGLFSREWRWELF